MITPFDKDMLVAHLANREIEAEIDDDGDYRFALAVDGNEDLALVVFLGAEGINDDVLSIRCIGMVTIPPEGFLQVMSACNQWNIERRYPKAALVVSAALDPESGNTQQTGQVHLMCHFPLGAGVTQPLVDDLINETVGGGLQFWQWMPDWLQQVTNQHSENATVEAPPDASLN
jgi:hypothetical protein